MDAEVEAVRCVVLVAGGDGGGGGMCSVLGSVRFGLMWFSVDSIGTSYRAYPRIFAY